MVNSPLKRDTSGGKKDKREEGCWRANWQKEQMKRRFCISFSPPSLGYVTPTGFHFTDVSKISSSNSIITMEPLSLYNPECDKCVCAREHIMSYWSHYTVTFPPSSPHPPHSRQSAASRQAFSLRWTEIRRWSAHFFSALTQCVGGTH